MYKCRQVKKERLYLYVSSSTGQYVCTASAQRIPTSATICVRLYCCISCTIQTAQFLKVNLGEGPVGGKEVVQACHVVGQLDLALLGNRVFVDILGI